MNEDDIVNAGLVKPGDTVEYWTQSGEHLKFIVTAEQLQSVPCDTYKALVNNESRINLPKYAPTDEGSEE